MYLVTIAIPLYNAESYIKNTLLSALQQSFKSIEYLIINDQGTDKSIDIV
ncbi:MAG: glycosyltransferase family 2 protein, partial [Acetoanaerobium sp.]|nr:glycosyltransferase family 2 protein [Acetoanaerobium sp.]